MSRHALSVQPTGQRTLGPFYYAMPIMPAILSGGPLMIVITMQFNIIISFIVAFFFSVGLLTLWVCVMRIARQLDQLAPPVEVRDDSSAIARQS